MICKVLTSLFVFLLYTSSAWCQSALVLNGAELTIEQVVQVARFKRPIEVSPDANERVRRSHELLLAGAKANMPIYGLNQGVGLNKDRKIFIGDAIDPEVKKISEEFNVNMIYSHSIGVGPNMPEELVRATMLVRLNMLLKGASGIQPSAIDLFVEFLNQELHPVLPCRGSIGEADIGILAHIALAMIGEADVVFHGTRIPAKEAFASLGIVPLKPFAKDSLAILSSNAFSTGYASLTLYDASKLLDHMNLVFAMSLEGLNGNVAPFLPQVQKLRPYCSQWRVAKKVEAFLEGSFLWQVDETRPLQDPLSFRDATQIHGATLELIELLQKQLTISLNASDDNPAVILDIEPVPTTPSQVLQYYIQEGTIRGAIIPSANFEPLTWVVSGEALGISFAHISHSSARRMVVLATESFTGLSRFLAPDTKIIAFGTIQKAFFDLDTEIRALSNPVSADYFPVAGDIEDHATNATLVVRRLSKIVDNLIYIVAMEEMHAAQAIDLRRQKRADLPLGSETKKELEAFRKVVPFLTEDRVLQRDIENSYHYVKAKVKVQ